MSCSGKVSIENIWMFCLPGGFFSEHSLRRLWLKGAKNLFKLSERNTDHVTCKIGPLYFTKRLPLANQIQNLIWGYVFDIAVSE